MKNLITLISVIYLFSLCLTLNAQETSEKTVNRSPIYDYQHELSHTDTIPDFESRSHKIKITGTVYQSDGVTPAEDVLIYIEQADESGDFVLKTQNDKRYVHHRGWIKTNETGEYTFYTFIPGTDVRSKEIRYIHTLIKVPNKAEYEIHGFMFDDDPRLNKRCRKTLGAENLDSILKPIKQGDLLVANRDIILKGDVIAKK